MSRADRRPESDGHELVQVAYVGDQAEAEMIRGLLATRGIVSMVQSVGVDASLLVVGVPNPAGGPQRVVVRAEQFEEARAALAEVAAENAEEEWPEIANAEHLARGGRRRRRNYGSLGAYVRATLAALVLFAVAYGLYLLFRMDWIS
jgi:Putative prokaryotic signal transducing protein